MYSAHLQLLLLQAARDAVYRTRTLSSGQPGTMSTKRRSVRRPSRVNRFLNNIRHRSITGSAGEMALTDIARATRSKVKHAPNGTAVRQKPRNLELIGFEQTFWKDLFYSCVSMSWAWFLCLTIVCYTIVVRRLVRC